MDGESKSQIVNPRILAQMYHSGECFEIFENRAGYCVRWRFSPTECAGFYWSRDFFECERLLERIAELLTFRRVDGGCKIFMGVEPLGHLCESEWYKYCSVSGEWVSIGNTGRDESYSALMDRCLPVLLEPSAQQAPEMIA